MNKETIGTMLNQFENFISNKTVIGEPIYVDDMVLIPVVDVSFGCACAGGNKVYEKQNGDTIGGGIGGKVSPSAVMVIKDGTVRMVSVKNQDAVTKVIDMVPDLVDRVKSKFTKEDAAKAVEAVKAEETAE